MGEPTCACLFGGGDGAGLGLRDAGFEHIWSVEKDPRIAEVAQMNGFNSVVADILETDPRKYERPDWLHASPVCKNFSTAKKNGKETQLDIDCGRKTAEFIEVLQPEYFSLENVRAYQGAIAYKTIVDCLNRNGYHCYSKVVNAADYGVPQSRKRLILIAHKGDFRWGFDPFSTGNQKHAGWYQAVEDLLDELPDSQLSDWQIKALPKELQIDNYLLHHGNTGSNGKKKHIESVLPSNTLDTSCTSKKAILVHPTDQRTCPVNPDEAPSFTLTAGMRRSSLKALLLNVRASKNSVIGIDPPCEDQCSHTIPATVIKQPPKALLIEKTGARSDRPLQTRTAKQPSWTIRALGQDSHWHRSTAIVNTRVVQLSIRCLARLQGFPDWYQFPEQKSLSGTIIGNSVCPPVMTAITKKVIP